MLHYFFSKTCAPKIAMKVMTNATLHSTYKQVIYDLLGQSYITW